MTEKKCAYVQKIILLVCCFLAALSLGVLAADDDRIVKVGSFEEFSDAVIGMIDENKTESPEVGGADVEDEYCNRRLIVKTKNGALNVEQYHPISVVQADSLYVLQFASCGEARAAREKLQKLGTVEYAEPDYNMEAEAASATTAKHYSWGVSAIGADKLAASLTSKKTQEIKVAVVDSGVASHPFLSGRVLPGYDFVDNDENPEDQNRHGTHVSGAVVDCTPGLNVKILPVRVLDERGRGVALTVGLGVRYAADNGASVINLSLSGRHSNFMDENIDYAIKKGVTVVVAAGNSGKDVEGFCPSHIKEAIVVGAVDSGLKAASFSNTGNSLDVVAPGVGINGPVLGNKFAKLNGTSMAAPHVAALAAMFKLQDTSRSPKQIEKMIQNNARDLGAAGWDRTYGYGLAEAYKTATPAAPTKVTLSKSKLSLKVGKSATLKATVTPKDAETKLTWKSSSTKVATVKNGKVTAKKAGTATVTVTTGNNKKAVCKVTVTKKTTKKTQPKKVTLDKKKLSIQAGSSATLKATVSPKGAVQKLTWKSGNTKVATVKNGKVTAKKAGKTTITVTTGNGKKVSCQVTVTKKKSQREQALANYKKMLEKNTKYKYFSVCYINGDNIPDLMALTKKNSSNYVYYINGIEAADQMMGMAAMGDPDIDELTYYYYPKRNLVMYRYKDAIPELYYWEDYSTFVSCKKNGYKHALMEVLTKSWEASNSSAAEYGYYYFSNSSVLEAQYDDLLGKWVAGKDVTEKEFNSLLAGFTKKTKRQEMQFVKNTAANRKKYLSK